MKRIVIFDTYPSGKKEVEILRESINSFKASGWDSLIVSHLPIDEETSKLVTYVIYDSNNTFLPAEYTPFYWLSNTSFTVQIFNAGHTLPICRNVNTSLHLAKALKYDQFVFTESDVVMHPEDLQKLVGYMDEMTEKGKKMLFFKPEDYIDCGSHVYETLLFGGDVNYFLDTFVPPLDVQEWIDVPMGYTLELSFYERFHHDEEKFLILNDHSSRIFDKSGVNLLRYGLFNCEMVYNETSPEEPVLFIINSLIINERRYVEVVVNNHVQSSAHVGKGMYWLNSYKLDDTEITVIVYDELGQYAYFAKKFKLSKDNNFKEKGKIKFES